MSRLPQKVVVLNDLHFGYGSDDSFARNSLNLFFDELEDFVKNKKPDVLVVNGDLYDNRKGPSTIAIENARNQFSKMKDAGVGEVWVSIGNHDIYYRNSLRPNSPEQTLVGVVDKFLTEPEIGDDYAIFPWIIDENEFFKQLSTMNNFDGFMFTHMDILGADLSPTVKMPSGFKTSVFPEKSVVINGHIHYPSQSSNVHNIGLQYQPDRQSVDVPGQFAYIEKGKLEKIARKMKTVIRFGEIDEHEDLSNVMVLVENEEQGEKANKLGAGRVQFGIKKKQKTTKANNDRQDELLELKDAIKRHVEENVKEYKEQVLSVLMKVVK